MSYRPRGSLKTVQTAAVAKAEKTKGQGNGNVPVKTTQSDTGGPRRTGNSTNAQKTKKVITPQEAEKRKAQSTEAKAKNKAAKEAKAKAQEEAALETKNLTSTTPVLSRTTGQAPIQKISASTINTVQSRLNAAAVTQKVTLTKKNKAERKIEAIDKRIADITANTTYSKDEKTKLVESLDAEKTKVQANNAAFKEGIAKTKRVGEKRKAIKTSENAVGEATKNVDNLQKQIDAVTKESGDPAKFASLDAELQKATATLEAKKKKKNNKQK